MAFKWLYPFKVEMKKCQKVKSNNLLNIPKDDDKIEEICSEAYRQYSNYILKHKSNYYQELWDRK